MKNKIHPIAKKLGYDSNESFYLDYPTQEHYTKEFGNGGTTKKDKELKDKQLGLQLQNRTGSSFDSNPSLSRNTVSLEATPDSVKNFINTTRVGQSKYKDGTKPFISGEAAYTLPMKTNNLTSALEFNAGVNYDNGINASAGAKPYLNYEFKNKSNPFKRNFSVEGGVDAKVFTPTLTNDPKYKDAGGMKNNPAQVNSFVKGYYNKNKKGFTANAGLERSLIDNSNYASAGIGYNFAEGGILKNAPSRTTPEITRLANGGYIKKFDGGGTPFNPYSSNLSGASSASTMPDAQPAAINMTGENAASTVAAPTDPTGKEVTGLQSPYTTPAQNNVAQNTNTVPTKNGLPIPQISGGSSGGRQSQLTGDPTTDYYLKAADRYHNRWNKAAKIGITAAGLTADALGAAGAGSAIAGGINKTFGFGGDLTLGMLKGNDFNINPPKDLNLSAPKNLNLPTPGSMNLGTPGKIPVPFSGGSSPMPTGSRPMIMANGGPVPMNVVNADNKPQLTRYSGLKHSQGGIALGNTGNEVETGETRLGDNIYSDQIKYDKNKTFADMSKKIDNKFSKRDNDNITNTTKKRELDSLFARQESLKQMQNKTQFAKGGKMYNDGEIFDSTKPLTENEYNNKFGKPGRTDLTFDVSKLNTDTNDSNIPKNLNYQSPELLSSLEKDAFEKNKNFTNIKYSYSEPSVNTPKNKRNLDLSWLNPALQAGLTMAGNRKPLPVNNYQLKNPALMDSTIAKRENRDAFSGINSDLRTSGLSAGQYLASRMGTASQEAGRNSEIDNAYRTDNIGIKNQFKQMNTATDKEVQELNAREIDASKTAKQFRNQNIAKIIGGKGQEINSENSTLPDGNEWVTNKLGKKIGYKQIGDTTNNSLKIIGKF